MRSQGGLLRKCSRIAVCLTEVRVSLQSSGRDMSAYTHKEQEHSEANDKEQRPSQVGVIHNALIDATEGIQDSQGLGTDMKEVNTKLY